MKKSTSVKVILPVNIEKKKLPKSFLEETYTIPNLTVKKYSNVFVSHEGICLKNMSILPRSTFNTFGFSDNTFGFQHLKLVTEQYLVSRFGKSLKYINLKDEPYLLIYTKWFGYYFWITSCLPRLIEAVNSSIDFTLIYPETWKDIEYVNESLKLFPNIKIRVIPSGEHMLIQDLVLPEIRPWSINIIPERIKIVRKTFLNIKLPDIFLGEKIYVSRKKAKCRRIVNEEELLIILKQVSFGRPLI